MNAFLPSFIDLLYLDKSRAWDHVNVLKSLCFAKQTFCFYNDDSLTSSNPYEFYRMDQSGTVEKGLIILAFLISDDDMAELLAGEAAEVEEERTTHKEDWWRAY